MHPRDANAACKCNSDAAAGRTDRAGRAPPILIADKSGASDARIRRSRAARSRAFVLRVRAA